MTTLPNRVLIDTIEFCNNSSVKIIGGINVLESKDLAFRVAEHFAKVCGGLGLAWVFKASFDKANRTSIHSFRGPGLELGLKWLEEVKREFKVPIITDVHEPHQASRVAEVADCLQIPAFLARQTDLVVACAQTQKPLHIKKPQFLAPEDMVFVAQKCAESGNSQVLLGERGSAFGYHNLVVDMLGMEKMKAYGPVVFDTTHSLQTPTSQGSQAGGRAEMVDALARCGVALGIAALFVETHPNPSEAKCDGPCALRLDKLDGFLRPLKKMDDLVKSFV